MNIPAKKLGFGFMRLPLLNKEDQKSVDLEQVQRMVDLFMARGYTYCDTAWMYHDFASEDVVGRTVVDRYPREAFTVATKMPDMMLKNAAEVPEIFAAQKKNLHVDFFDYYLIHNMNNVNYEKCRKYGVLEFLRQKREQGDIRCLGFSFHDTAAFLDKVLTENPWFEFVQLQINYLDWDSAGVQAHKCYDVCVKHGKKVIVMEPVKGGTLANPPEQVKAMLSAVHPDWSPAQWAIRFAASLPDVLVVLSGMSNMAQLEENTAFMEHFTPLTEAEMALLGEAAEIIRKTITIPCTACRYCIEANHCPKHIPIPKYLDLFNRYSRRAQGSGSIYKKEYRQILSDGMGKASSCIACGACQKVCPQRIRIPEWLREVAEKIEEQ